MPRLKYLLTVFIIPFSCIFVKFRELLSILLEYSTGKKMLLNEKGVAVSHVHPTPGSISLYESVVKLRGC